MKTPLRNILAVISGDLGSRAIGFFVTMYLARTLLPASFGVINIGLAVLGYLSLLNVPGVQMVEVRNVAATAGDFRERAGSILSFRLVVAPLLLAGTWIVVTAIGMPAETRDAVLLYSLSVVPMALSLDWLFQGREDFRRVSTSRLLSVFLFGIVVLLLVRQEHDVRQTAIAFLMGNIAAALYLGFVYRRLPGHHGHADPVPAGTRQGRGGTQGRIPGHEEPVLAFPRLRWDPAAWKGILRDNGPAGTAMLLAQSVTNLPPLVIGVFVGNNDVGMFSAAMKLAFVFLLIDRTFNVLYLPLASRYAASKRDEYPYLLSVTVKSILVLVVPLVIVGCVIADPLLLLVFGSHYTGSGMLFRILSLYVLVTTFNSVFVNTLIAFGKTKDYAVAGGAGAVGMIVCVVLLTALGGTVGAAWGVVAGETIILGLLAARVSHFVRLPGWRDLAKPVAACVVMAVGAIATDGMNVFFSLMVSLLAFFFVLFSTNGMPREELRFLKERLL